MPNRSALRRTHLLSAICFLGNESAASKFARVYIGGRAPQNTGPPYLGGMLRVALLRSVRRNPRRRAALVRSPLLRRPITSGRDHSAQHRCVQNALRSLSPFFVSSAQAT